MGQLLFNIFKCDLLNISEEIEYASYVDDKLPFAFEATAEYAVNSLENCSTLFEWFE